MRLNFYSRRRRFNKSLLGSHKNSLTLTKKPKTCDLSSYACWVAAVATLYATYPRAFRLRNRKGLRHSMLALTPHSGDCSGASLEMPSEAFLHTKTHSLTKRTKTCDLSSYACWVAAVATLYATYPRAFRLRDRTGRAILCLRLSSKWRLVGRCTRSAFRRTPSRFKNSNAITGGRYLDF